MNKIAMKIKLTETQINRLKKALSENDMYSNQPTEPTKPSLSPSEDLYNAIDQSLTDEYSMHYNEFADVIAKYFNDFYGAHLKEKFLEILNSKIDSL